MAVKSPKMVKHVTSKEKTIREKTIRVKRWRAKALSQLKSGWNRGLRQGYESGWAAGYEKGIKHLLVELATPRETQETQETQAIRSAIVESPVGLSIFQCRLLYVALKHGGPYVSINKAIVEALGKLGVEVHTIQSDESVIQAAKQIKPDVVLVLMGDELPLTEIDKLRDMKIKTAVIFTDDPYYADVTANIAVHFDYVFTNEVNSVPFYVMHGCSNVYYLPMAADTKLYGPVQTHEKYQSDICIIGTAWNNRLDFVDEIADYLADKNCIIVGPRWEKLRNYDLLENKIPFESLTPEEVNLYFNGAKIVVNLHRSHDDTTIADHNIHKWNAYSPNPRFFEIGAAGAFQLTDHREDLSRFYLPGKEMETYSSPQEFIRKANHYLKDVRARNEIAYSAFIRTMNEHTYVHRMSYLLENILNSKRL